MTAAGFFWGSPGVSAKLDHYIGAHKMHGRDSRADKSEKTGFDAKGRLYKDWRKKSVAGKKSLIFQAVKIQFSKVRRTTLHLFQSS